jgi:hypothetical protein
MQLTSSNKQKKEMNLEDDCIIYRVLAWILKCAAIYTFFCMHTPQLQGDAISYQIKRYKLPQITELFFEKAKKRLESKLE